MTDVGVPIGRVLRSDHDRLDGLLEAYRDSASSPSAIRTTLWTPFANGLRSHIRFEEAALFPMYLDAGGSEPMVSLMLDEHRRILELLEAMDRRLTGDRPETGDLEEALLNVLWAHDAREEEQLYPWIDANVPPERRLELASRFDGRENI